MPDIATTTNDSGGVQRLKSNVILFSKFIDVSISSFANPGTDFFGYASDGFYREGGVAVVSPATGQPAKSSWATEAEHTSVTTDRNLEDAFPQKIFVILTSSDLVILNANTLTVWMRFDLASASAIAGHYFLGGSTTTLLDADFDGGVLCITQTDSGTASSNGMIVADFRRDELFRVTGNSTSANGIKSPKTISQRNAAGAWSGTSSISSLSLVESTCNNVSMLTSQNQTYVALSHDSGISLVRIQPGNSGYAIAAESRQLFQKSYTGVDYEAVDDFDGDALTPTFKAANNSAWVSDGIRAGDILVISSTRYKISEVGTNLTLEDEIAASLSVSGGTYQIIRSVPRLVFQTLSSLLYANGKGFVTQQQDQTYQTTANNIEPWETPDYTAPAPSASVYSFVVRGGSLYVGTDVGIYRVDLTDQSSGLPSSLDYSASSGEGSYKVLSHNKTTALSVDPESGHLIIATHSGSASEVIDLDVENLHQVVKRTTSDQEIKSMASYKNPDGPPSVSVS